MVEIFVVGSPNTPRNARQAAKRSLPSALILTIERPHRSQELQRIFAQLVSEGTFPLDVGFPDGSQRETDLSWRITAATRG